MGVDKPPYHIGYDDFMNEEEHVITSTASLFGSYQLPLPKKRVTERGELLSYFSQRIGKPIGFVAMKVTGLKLPDLYYLKSSCDQAAVRGVPWGAAFYTSLK